MAVKVQVEALDLIAQLGQEMVVAYEAEDATVATIVAALLNFQLRTPKITVGTIADSIKDLTRSIKVDGDTVLRALYKLHSTVGGYIHVDNDRKLQWADSIGKDKGQQLRYRKNLKGIERDINYHGLVNRLYAYGAGEGTARIKLSDAEGQDEDYVENEASQATWGGIYPGSLVDISITHPDTLLEWAKLRLAEIKDPIISYSVNVIDLSESDVADFGFDELQLGSIVKVIDEDLGIDVSVSIVKITHHDLANPQDMTVELSSRVKDITDTLMEVYGIQQFQQHIATVIGAGQVIVKGKFTVLDWATGGETTIDGSNIETGTVTLSMLNFVPLSSSGETGEIVATINATAEGIKISASKVDIVAGVQTFKQPGIPTSENIGDIWYDTDDNNKAYRAACVGAEAITPGEWELVRDTQISTNMSAITVNETQIGLNVTSIGTLDGQMTDAEGAIVVNAEAITLEVTNRASADGVLQGQITVNADNILLKVSTTDYNGTTICSKINLTSSAITIDAKHLLVNADCHFTAGYDPTDKVPDGGAAADVNDNVTTISGGKITTNTLSAAAIMTSSLGAKTITLNGASSILKSSDYSAGSAGWQIKGDGFAEFNEMTIRGTVSVGQDIKSSNYVAATSGWIIEGSGDAEFNTVTVRGNIQAGVGSSISAGYITSGDIATARLQVHAADGINAGATTISGGKITTNTLDVDAIKTSTLGAKTITLSGASSIIKGNYSAGVSGWQIKGDGNAEFNQVTVRGTIYASAGEFTGTLKTSNIETGKTLTVNGAISAASGKVVIDDNGITVTDQYMKLQAGAIAGYVYESAVGGNEGLHLATTTGDIWLGDSLIAKHIYPRDSGYYDVGSDSKHWRKAYIDEITNQFNMADGCRPTTSQVGDIGGTDKWPNKMYANTYYGKNQDIQAFQGHDDIAMLKAISLTPKGKLDVESFPPELLESDESIKSNLKAKKVPVGVKRGIDMVNWQSLTMGAVLQIANKIDNNSTRLDELEARVAALN